MDDFGNSILHFHPRTDVRGLAAFILCAEGTVAPLISDQLLDTYGVIA